jgi:hypothetical protein
MSCHSQLDQETSLTQRIPVPRLFTTCNWNWEISWVSHGTCARILTRYVFLFPWLPRIIPYRKMWHVLRLWPMEHMKWESHFICPWIVLVYACCPDRIRNSIVSLSQGFQFRWCIIWPNKQRLVSRKSQKGERVLFLSPSSFLLIGKRTWWLISVSLADRNTKGWKSGLAKHWQKKVGHGTMAHHGSEVQNP